MGFLTRYDEELREPLMSPEAPVPCPHVADFIFLQSKMGTDHRERSERSWMNITGLVHQLRDAQQFPGPQSAGAGRVSVVERDRVEH